MKIKWLRCGVALIVITMLSASGIYPQNKEPKQDRPFGPSKKGTEKKDAGVNMEEMMAAYAKYAEPGEHHRHLKALEGTWDTTSKVWMAPGAPPSESKGTSENKLILGGRFLHQDYKGELLGKPFMGLGLTGYDNFKRKYTGVWMDSMSTSVWYSLGTCDESGKVFTMVGEFDDPVTSQKKKAKTILRIVNDNKHLFEWYEPGPDGKEHKTLEVIYTRK